MLSCYTLFFWKSQVEIARLAGNLVKTHRVLTALIACWMCVSICTFQMPVWVWRDLEWIEVILHPHTEYRPVLPLPPGQGRRGTICLVEGKPEQRHHSYAFRMGAGPPCKWQESTTGLSPDRAACPTPATDGCLVPWSLRCPHIKNWIQSRFASGFLSGEHFSKHPNLAGLFWILQMPTSCWCRYHCRQSFCGLTRRCVSGILKVHGSRK